MQTITSNKTGKLIQHWPYIADKAEPQVCVGNNYSEADLWSDLARHTLRGEGGVLVVGLYSNDPHRVIRENGDVDTYQRETRHYVIREQLLKHGDVDLSRVVYPHLDPITRKITVQAREAYRGGLENLETGQIDWSDVPARLAGIETKKFSKRFHLGNRRNLHILIAAVNERATVKSILRSYSDEGEKGGCPISAVLIMEPNVERGDLNYLPDFRAACPNVDVYIFHRWDESKYGVEVTGDVDNWENEFPALSECEFAPPQVIVDDLLIKGNIHVAAGRFEAFKTMALIELFSAVLDERPAFDHFAVR